jgi:hypothetical protein
MNRLCTIPLFCITLALASAPIALAQTVTPTEASVSVDPVRKAINGAARTSFGSWIFLPGYGLSTSASILADWKKDWPVKFLLIKSMTTTLASTVKAVDGGDWMSYTIIYVSLFASDNTITTRIKFKDLSDANAWEVWINNTKQ